jgi:hypothetical protein
VLTVHVGRSEVRTCYHREPLARVGRRMSDSMTSRSSLVWPDANARQVVFIIPNDDKRSFCCVTLSGSVTQETVRDDLRADEQRVLAFLSPLAKTEGVDPADGV